MSLQSAIFESTIKPTVIMSNKETMMRHSHIIVKLRQRPHNFKEINRTLKDKSEFTGYNLTCSVRTFQRDIEQIRSLYDIEIRFNRSEGVYEIKEDLSGNHNERLLEAFELYNALQLSSSFSNHILPEKRKPSGTHNMHGLFHAIKNRFKISFEHEKYWEEETGKSVRHVKPLALIEARFRWYLIAKDTGDDMIKTFGLDRISNIVFSKKKFIIPQGYDPEKVFQHCFGIINDEKIKPKKIVLSFTSVQANYVKSLPLHHSQKVISETEEECIMELYLSPTYDFVMELMGMGKEVKVVSPKSLQREICQKLNETLAQY